MVFLTIDTSERSVVGVVSENAAGECVELACAVSEDARHHVENLAPMVSHVLEEAGVHKPDMVVVGTGPASFTGLRAGIMTARVLARGWNVPIVGVSSLEVLALAACERGANEVLALIDARRKELFALRGRAMGGEDIAVLDAEHIIKPEDVPTLLAERPAVVAAHTTKLWSEAEVVMCAPTTMARLARSHLWRKDAGEDIDVGTEPKYLRRPDIHGA